MRKMISLILALLITQVSFSQTLAQWRGKNRNGFYNEKNLLKQWPDSGPQQIWFADSIGAGYSSASVTDDMIYISGMKDTLDYVSAIDHNGKIKWQVKIGQS